jgi:hypothetical protein
VTIIFGFGLDRCREIAPKRKEGDADELIVITDQAEAKSICAVMPVKAGRI